MRVGGTPAAAAIVLPMPTSDIGRNTMSLPQRGTAAPPFSLPNQHGETLTLDDLRGRHVLLWWYPKADTPG